MCTPPNKGEKGTEGARQSELFSIWAIGTLFEVALALSTQSTARSLDNEGATQAPAVVQVVGGKTRRVSAGRYAVTSRPQGGGVCG